ncbi:hypothetical protein ACFSL6_23825 [Paenibacillus thailandensis]|uniref:ABC transporter permease n=1 Tax=Paenibacillus thailandensis TaxID=393250 RepID=A0ABW5R1L5_9BACL
MSHYLKLVHLEISRFRLVLLSLMVLTFGFQTVGIIVTVNRELSMRAENPLYNGVDGSFVPEGTLSFAWAVYTSNFWYYIPIMISLVVLLAYMPAIWYREWFGRNTVIYRLLMLPGARFRVYTSKLTAVLLFVFAMIGFQMLVLPVQESIFNLMVPSAERVDTYLEDAIAANQLLSLFLPRSLEQFVYSYGLGMIGVTAVFAVILLERSFRWLGLLAGLVYLAVCWFVLLLPLLDTGYFYPIEYYFFELAACALVLCASVGLGGWLLARKISV